MISGLALSVVPSFGEHATLGKNSTKLVLPVRIELTTSPLPRGCSTTELRQRRATRFTEKLPRTPRSLPQGQKWRNHSEMTKRGQDDGPDDHKAREQARLAAALRENLKRRKAQARGRATTGSPEDGAKPHDSAGIDADKPTT